MTNIELETYSAVKNMARNISRDIEDINWEQRRYEIAKDCLASYMSSTIHGTYDKDACVENAIYLADKLIEKLRKKD